MIISRIKLKNWKNFKEIDVPLKNRVFAVGPNRSIGPYYNGCLSEFVLNYWNIENAIKHSDSLKRAYQKLKDFLPG